MVFVGYPYIVNLYSARGGTDELASRTDSEARSQAPSAGLSASYQVAW